jgi:zinc transport system ATP-binding protein
MTGTSHLLNSEVNTLSGGEFQRVLLSRAIAKKPELLVLDEPVQGVDSTGEQAMYNLIETIAKSLNCGILLISHDLHFVMSATTHVICLNGHICCSGTPRAVSTSSEFRSLYGSKISANLMLYEHMHDHTHGADGSIEHSATLEKNSKVSQENSINA